jgi:hypothetical protein
MSTNVTNIVLGAGQVGTAVSELVYGDVEVYDQGEWEDGERCTDPYIIHICFPYSDKFVQLVDLAMKRWFNAQAIIIHSTVSPTVFDTINADHVLYSPIVGRHADDFSMDIRAHDKFMAGSRRLFDCVAWIFDPPIEYWGTNRAELAYAKIMSTTYMYYCIMFEKIISKECEKEGYDRYKVYTRWNRMYNDGIEERHPEWKRPVYDHYEDATPGGHCLRPNIHLVTNKITDILKNYEDDNS